jgi:thiol-disulfide isomerase/thioredoxin
LYSVGCPGCKSRAIPYAKAWHEQYGAQLQIIGVHTQLGPAKYSVGQIEEITAIHKIPFPIFEDIGHETFALLEGEGTPHWVLVDADGQIIRSVFGSMANAIHRIDYALLELFET